MNWPREMIWLLKEKIRQLYYPAIAFSIAVIAGILSILCFNLRFGLRYPFPRRHWLDDVFIVWSFPAVSWATRTVVVLRNDNEIHSRKKYLQISAQKDGESERDRPNERTNERDWFKSRLVFPFRVWGGQIEIEWRWRPLKFFSQTLFASIQEMESICPRCDLRLSMMPFSSSWSGVSKGSELNLRDLRAYRSVIYDKNWSFHPSSWRDNRAKSSPTKT